MLNDLIKSLGLEKIHLVGHGVGGFVAQHFALDYKDNLSSLILVNSSKFSAKSLIMFI